eukprot:GHVU01090303.1.p1 GENE.GHVU01090303.1~~GHVU01090303.1.p1  ORF type:complete len:569 (+),score=107.31 GHVU01090303.1:74-1780(+)
MAAAGDGDKNLVAFKLDIINFNERTWGPTNTRECLDSCLYERLGKPAFDPVQNSRGGHDSKFGLIKSCDFTFQSQLRAQKDGRLAPGMTWQDDENQFTHVDSRPLKTSKKPYYYKKPQKLSTAAYQQKQQEEKAETKGKKAQMKPASHRGKHMWHRFQHRPPRQAAEWSVEISSEWQSIAELPIAQLLKMYVDGSKVQYKDKCWQGTICVFDSALTRIRGTASDAVPLKPARQEVLYPSLHDDQVIASDLTEEKSPAQVAAADFVLATLMAAGQSKYSWHINVYKEGDTLIFDKPEQNSNCENLTVNETGYDVPLQEDPVIINRPPELSREAMKVNRFFSVQCVHAAQPVKTFEAPSFWEDVESPAPKGYRYRYVTLPGKDRIQEGTSERQKEPVVLLTRGEVDAVVVGTVEPGKSKWDAATPVSLKALNEYSVAGKKPWKSQLMGNLKGSLLVAEIRSNSAKMAKWVAQAMISGCEHIKLGYVSRRDNASNASHDILSVQSYQTNQLAAQMSFKPDNAWGIVRGLIDLLRDQKDGNYVIVRDPTRAFINVYYVPDSPEDNAVTGDLN